MSNPTPTFTGLSTVAEVLALGLEAGELLDWPTAPLMFSFCDFDGNRLYCAEPA